MIDIGINGTMIEAPEGVTILEAARAAGIHIPTLCDYPELSPDGCCRVCLVEVEGAPQTKALVAACTTPAVNGMKILTHSRRALETRRTVVELMLARHPLECTTCASHGDCELARLCRELDIRASRYAPAAGEAHRFPLDDKNPFILRDRNKCVLCGRCVRVCDAFAQYHAVDFQGRSSRVIVDTAPDGRLDESDCVFCGQCAAACPVGALSSRPAQDGGALWRAESVKTVCPYCGVGCELAVKVNPRTKQIADITGDHASPSALNRGRTCVKGRFAYGFVHSDERLTAPLIREDGVFRPTSWAEAIARVADGLSAARRQNGPDAVGFFSSARCTNEENYLMQRLAREVAGTNNVDHCAHL